MMRTFSRGNSRRGKGCRDLVVRAAIVLALAGAGGLGTAPGQVITTVAGAGVAGYSGDGGAATAARLNSPFGVAVDSGGNLYITDTNNHRVRKVTTAGVISTVAGVETVGYSGDGGSAAAAQLNSPTGVAVDSARTL